MLNYAAQEAAWALPYVPCIVLPYTSLRSKYDTSGRQGFRLTAIAIEKYRILLSLEQIPEHNLY